MILSVGTLSIVKLQYGIVGVIPPPDYNIYNTDEVIIKNTDEITITG